MDALITNIGRLLSPRARHEVSESLETRLHTVERVEILIRDGRIASIDPMGTSKGAERVIDAVGGTVIPGIVEPHTHLGHPREISQQWTACEATPIEASLRHLLAHGVTTVEIKAGEGDSSDAELGELRLLRQVRDTTPQRIVPTYVAGFGDTEHEDAADRVARMIGETIPAIRRGRLAQFLDVRVSEGARADQEIRAVLRAARGAGLRLKIHASSSDQAASYRLACHMEACSVDHVQSLGEREAEGLAHVGVTPVLAPCRTDLAIPERAALVDSQGGRTTVAFGSNYDFAHGGIESPWVLLAMAAKRGWSLDDGLSAMTLNAARALDLSDDVGSIELGKRADLLILARGEPWNALCRVGRNPIREVLIAGRVVYRAP